MKKRMRLASCFLVLMVMLLQLSMPAFAYRIGDVIGHALTTDIAATINGYDIPSYNVDGYTYIVAEDLKYYGFSVWYDNSTRSLYVDRDYSQSWVSKVYTKPAVSASDVGKRAHSLLYTDISTYIGNTYVSGYNIDGQTIIRFDSLSAFGGVSYDNSKREISLGLSGLNYNPNPARRGNSINNNSSSSSSSSSSRYYPGTSIPTYTSVTGVRLKETFTLDEGNVVYVYDFTSASDVGDYWGELYGLGWDDLSEDDVTTDEVFESSFYKGSTFVIVNVYLDLEEVWIVWR